MRPFVHLEIGYLNLIHSNVMPNNLLYMPMNCFTGQKQRTIALIKWTKRKTNFHLTDALPQVFEARAAPPAPERNSSETQQMPATPIRYGQAVYFLRISFSSLSSSEGKSRISNIPG